MINLSNNITHSKYEMMDMELATEKMVNVCQEQFKTKN